MTLTLKIADESFGMALQFLMTHNYAKFGYRSQNIIIAWTK